MRRNAIKCLDDKVADRSSSYRHASYIVLMAPLHTLCSKLHFRYNNFQIKSCHDGAVDNLSVSSDVD